MDSKRVVIVGVCRTPIGKFGGMLSEVKTSDLGAVVIKEAIKRAKLSTNDIEEVFMGSVLQAGQGQNVARQASIKAGLPVGVPATTINVICGSGLEAINIAATQIKSGISDIIVAGGMENMSAAPYLLNKARFGYRMGNGEFIDTIIHDGLQDAFSGYHMGITAENVAEQWHLTREELDIFAKNSQDKATIARDRGAFDAEIVAIKVIKKKKEILFSKDEAIREETTLEKLSNLNPVFKTGGIVPAGNSSGINDGAAALVLRSEEKALEKGIEILAYWDLAVLAGVEPEIMGMGPVASTKKLLKKLDLTIDDIDLIELNEAFAAQSVAVVRELNLNPEIVNVNGGTIALGHPLGASGARILVTLLYEMRRRKSKKGLASLCIGGGMGCSALIELPEEGDDEK
jgi:acetyl-CoA C-acetyltransferase